MRRDGLQLVHDLVETVLLVGVLVALVVYVVRDRRDPLELFARHGGMDAAHAGGGW